MYVCMYVGIYCLSDKMISWSRNNTQFQPPCFFKLHVLVFNWPTLSRLVNTHNLTFKTEEFRTRLNWIRWMWKLRWPFPNEWAFLTGRSYLCPAKLEMVKDYKCTLIHATEIKRHNWTVALLKKKPWIHNWSAMYFPYYFETLN